MRSLFPVALIRAIAEAQSLDVGAICLMFQALSCVFGAKKLVFGDRRFNAEAWRAISPV